MLKIAIDYELHSQNQWIGDRTLFIKDKILSIKHLKYYEIKEIEENKKSGWELPTQ